jgi:hypothetical protein
MNGISRKIIKFISGNKNPKYVDGLRKLNLREHVLCIIGLIFVSIIFGTIFSIIDHMYNYNINKSHVFSLSKVIAISIIIINRSSTLIPTLFLLTFCKISGKKRVSGLIIYQIWFTMSFIIFISLFYYITYLT